VSKPKTERQHAELGASNSERWINCSGSVRMERGIPNTGSDYALEGTVAHDVAERALTMKLDPAVWLDTEIDGVLVDEEMVEGVRLYVETVRAELAEGDELHVEVPISLAALNPPKPMYGTSDARIFKRVRRRLIVIDLKYGQGYAVEVVDNDQLYYYALGALLGLEEEYGSGLVDEIELIIVQPRAAHPDGAVRRVVIPYLEIMDFALRILAAAERTQDPNAPLTPGRWCRFCRAKAVCPALKDQAQALARVDFAEPAAELALPTPPEHLTLEQLVKIANYGDVLVSYVGAVRRHIQGMLERGQEVPGFKLVAKRATRKWASERQVEEWAREAGVEPTTLYKEPELRSVAQLEKALGKGTIPAELVVKLSSGNTVAPVADKRPEIPAGPQQDFAALPPGEDAAATV
jgi:hypothetical protein